MTHPRIYLVRHGETAWSMSGQHTGHTDLPLTEQGEANARKLVPRLGGLLFGQVLTSPLQRARLTCDLAGFAPFAKDDSDLMEWNYGQYEGKRTVEILRQRPDWSLFRDGCPDGESLEQVSVRADLVVSRLREANADILIFSHKDFLRVLAVRWCELAPATAQCFVLNTASVSILSYNHSINEPVVQLWNDDRHLSQATS